MRFERGLVSLVAPLRLARVCREHVSVFVVRPLVLRLVLPLRRRRFVVAKVPQVHRWLGRAMGLDLHRESCEIAICESGQAYDAGRALMTAEGIEVLAGSLERTDRMVMEAQARRGRSPGGRRAAFSTWS